MNQEKDAEGKKFLGIHFRCCNVYTRIYKSKEGKSYRGQCPRCGKRVEVPIGEGGVSSRFFEAY
ncbi:MAG TPA: hypothetical protein PLE24_03275 [Chitinispirillaceae bacterium]|jgi:PHP family Zn ribbon phosphoesterase|nr:hypothetical protein [Chitinispirillaceae bacterium]